MPFSKQQILRLPVTNEGLDNRPQLLKNVKFKNEFAKFLQKEWQENHNASVIGCKTIYISCGGICVTVSTYQTGCEINSYFPQELKNNHEEADTLIGYHVAQLLSERGCSVLVRASDTDVLVILIGLLGIIKKRGNSVNNQVIMDCGSGNHRRLINVTNIVEGMENIPNLAISMLGFHAFTGCDFTSSFYRKGKVRQLDILFKSSEYATTFADLSNPDAELNMENIEAFVCEMYGLKQTKTINQARYENFKKMSGKSTSSKPLQNTKKIDCALLPPCQSTLIMHAKRSRYISALWARSCRADPSAGLDPLSSGWKMDGERLIPDWFDGESLPTAITDKIDDEQDSENEDEEWIDDSSDDDSD